LAGGNSYKIYDLKDKLIKDVKSEITVDPRNRINPSQALDALRIQNFFDGIRKVTALNAEILKGYQSTLLCQLDNIAVCAGNTSFKTDEKNGHILINEEAAKYWKRKYEPGWEPKI